MTLSAFLLAAIAVIPADRLAMADRLFNRGEYAAARVEYAALSGEKSIPADEVIYRLAECDRALGKSAEARRGYGELLEKFPTSPRADRSRLMRALAGTPEERAADLVSRMTLQEKIDQLGRNTKAVPRLGVDR